LLRKRFLVVLLGLIACVTTACSSAPSASPATTTASQTTSGGPSTVPRPDHVVVVIEENHGYHDVIGSAPYIDSLAAQGALFTQSFSITHPSQPNYLALFSGSTQGVTDDSCPQTFNGGNLGAQLGSAGFTFAGYSEDLPSTGFTGCSAGGYARKHAPWVNFPNVTASANRPFSAFPTDFGTLPTVSFVVPNLNDDMHNGSVAQGDVWLRQHMDAYAQWAKTHNSLLIVTWDEDDTSGNNQIPTIFVGANVKPGQYAERIDHYTVLRTIEDSYGLPPLGSAAGAKPITDIWS
jgi:acid phosphatase